MTTTIAPSTGAGALFTQQGVGTTPGYSALDLRRSEIVGPVQEGVYAAGDYMVTQRGAGANMSVDIAAGSGAFAAVQGDSVTGQGLYIVGPHSAAAINEVIAAADPTNPRVDIVILEIQDNVHDASGGNLARTRVLTGAPTAGANLTNRTNAPALPANALLLADVLVGAAVGSITNTVIRDRRKWARGASTYKRGVTSSPTTANAYGSATALTDMSLLLECSGVPLEVTFSGEFYHTSTTVAVSTELRIDGVAVSASDAGDTIRSVFSNGTSIGATLAWSVRFTPAAGFHTIAVYWFVASASGTANVTRREMLVREIVAQNTANNTTTSG